MYSKKTSYFGLSKNCKKSFEKWTQKGDPLCEYNYGPHVSLKRRIKFQCTRWGNSLLKSVEFLKYEDGSLRVCFEFNQTLISKRNTDSIGILKNKFNALCRNQSYVAPPVILIGNPFLNFYYFNIKDYFKNCGSAEVVKQFRLCLCQYDSSNAKIPCFEENVSLMNLKPKWKRNVYQPKIKTLAEYDWS